MLEVMYLSLPLPAGLVQGVACVEGDLVLQRGVGCLRLLQLQLPRHHHHGLAGGGGGQVRALVRTQLLPGYTQSSVQFSCLLMFQVVKFKTQAAWRGRVVGRRGRK